MTLAIILCACLAVVGWVYAGYPLLLWALGRIRPRPRRRAPVQPSVAVIVAAHNEEPIIASKVENLLASDYPSNALQIIVVSDGSTDRTVATAEDAGAHVVIDLPRVGKLRALNTAVTYSSADVLVFTDADSFLLPETLGELVSNFADAGVGAVAANEIHTTGSRGGVARGEGLYWRYEQKIKELEDRVGSAVSASGRLYAIRRELFTPSTNTAGADDFVVSTQAIVAGRRLAFDPHANVEVDAPTEGGTELRRKVHMMNRGLRASFSLGSTLSPARHGPYLAQLFFHKILRRFVGFFLLAMLMTSVVGVVFRSAWWWFALAPQLVFYVLAVAGSVVDRARRRVPKILSIPYYFCLANLAATLAVIALLRGARYEVWEPALARGSSTPRAGA